MSTVHLHLIVLFFSVQVLPYDILMVELDITNVRELEDFLINDCMYVVSFWTQVSVFMCQKENTCDDADTL